MLLIVTNVTNNIVINVILELVLDSSSWHLRPLNM